jgi:hypothetical protein
VGQSLLPHDGWLCLACLETRIPGKDTISKSMRKTLDHAAELRAALAEPVAFESEGLRNQAEWSRIMSTELRKQDTARARTVPQVNGEALPNPNEQPFYDTMAVPDAAAVEASLERTRLLLDYGIDAVAMALDTSASIGASNSVEKMLAHQLAVTHKNAMEQINRAHGACGPEIEIKRLAVAARLMTVYQQGLLALKKLRQGGRQQILVQYVNVSHGSQAIVGNADHGRENGPTMRPVRRPYDVYNAETAPYCSGNQRTSPPNPRSEDHS